MTKFKFFKKFSLGFLGNEWKDCYLKFNSITFDESKNIQNKVSSYDPKKQPAEVATAVIGILEKNFTEGKGVDENNKVIDVQKEDLKQFPIDVLSKAFEELMGAKPNPNA